MMYTYIVRGSVHVARLEDKDYSADLFSLQFDEPCNSYVKFQFSHVRFHTHCNGVVIPVSSKKLIWSSLQHWLVSKTTKNSTLCKQLIVCTAGLEHKIASDLISP
jgi:hypothetical protein